MPSNLSKIGLNLAEENQVFRGKSSGNNLELNVKLPKKLFLLIVSLLFAVYYRPLKNRW